MHKIQLRFSSAISRTSAVRSLVSMSLFALMSQFSIAAIDIDNFTPATNDRFDNDPTFIGTAHDWSGVGRTDAGLDRWLSIIAIDNSSTTNLPSNIFVSAAHLPPINGSTAVFYPGNDPAATPVTRTVLGGTQLCGSDLYVGHLDFAVGSNINKYAYETTLIPNIATYNATIANDYVFQPGVSPTTTGYGASFATNMALGENHVEDFLFNQTFAGLPGSGDFIEAFNDDPGDPGWETYDANVNTGDSGTPLMFPDTNGDLVIYGVAGARLDYSNGDVSSVYTYIAHDADCLTGISDYIDANINSVVPEPNSAVLLLFGFALMIRRRSAAV